MPPDAVNAMVTAAGRRAGLGRAVTPHQLRHVLSA
jgi:integrase/recombinase XerD